MTEDIIIEVLSDAFFTTLLIILPILGVSLVVGIIISIFQAATSIQEMTLTFVPKILVTAVTIIFLLPWMMDKMLAITNRFFTIFLTLLK
jgi:flagellar biosynthesis protein FliQ